MAIDTIAYNYIPKLCEAERKRVMRLIESANNDIYSITTDLWILRANQAILLHLKSHLLETKEFSNSLSAENVAEVVDQWQISLAKVVAATTNNCANMVPAVQLND